MNKYLIGVGIVFGITMAAAGIYLFQRNIIATCYENYEREYLDDYSIGKKSE